MEKFVKLTLEEYIRLGGDIENLNLINTNTTYDRKESGLRIKSIKDGGVSKSETPLYEVEYSNGEVKKYARMWIETRIEFALPAKYKKQ